MEENKQIWCRSGATQETIPPQKLQLPPLHTWWLGSPPAAPYRAREERPHALRPHTRLILPLNAVALYIKQKSNILNDKQR